MRRSTASLLTILICGTLFFSFAQKEESPSVAKLKTEANEALQLMVKEDFDTLSSRLSESTRKELTPERLKEFWDAVLAEAGPFQSVIKSEAKEGQKNSVVTMKCKFQKGTLFIRMGINSEHKISGLDIDTN